MSILIEISILHLRCRHSYFDQIYLYSYVYNNLYLGEYGDQGQTHRGLKKRTELERRKERLGWAQVKQEKKGTRRLSASYLKEQIAELRKIINAKDQEIGEKDRSIYTYKQSNLVLKKFKFDHDFKIKSALIHQVPAKMKYSNLIGQYSNLLLLLLTFL